MAYFSCDALRSTVRSVPPGVAVFLVQMHPLEGNMFFTYTSSDSPLHWVPCAVKETRYKLDDNYKITLSPIIQGFPDEHFYQSDLATMVGEGHALVLDPSCSWQSQVPKPPKVSWSERFEKFKRQFLLAIRLPRLS